MPIQRAKSDPQRPKPEPGQTPQQEQQSGKEDTGGRSGRGADSVLAHLIEQEKTRTRRTARS
jgi:hypothetical protein